MNTKTFSALLLCVSLHTYGAEIAAPQQAASANTETETEMDHTTRQRLSQKINALPVYRQLHSEKPDYDWLIAPQKVKAGIYRTEDGKGIVIANGLLAREFRIWPQRT